MPMPVSVAISNSMLPAWDWSPFAGSKLCHVLSFPPLANPLHLARICPSISLVSYVLISFVVWFGEFVAFFMFVVVVVIIELGCMCLLIVALGSR